MNNDSIREFFKRIAEGKSQSLRFDMLHNSSSLLPRSSQNESHEKVTFYASQHDFGVGLPPMAGR